jgi:phage-related protein
MSKPINWVGSARKDLCDFPEDARQVAGQQLRRVQEGENPDHYKPMSVAERKANEQQKKR